jgi:hypothetical protein
MFTTSYWAPRHFAVRYYPRGTVVEPPGDGVTRRISHVRIE